MARSTKSCWKRLLSPQHHLRFKCSSRPRKICSVSVNKSEVFFLLTLCYLLHSYFDVETRLVPVKASNGFIMDPNDAIPFVDENTIGIIVIMGSTYTGHFENVQLMNDLCTQTLGCSLAFILITSNTIYFSSGRPSETHWSRHTHTCRWSFRGVHCAFRLSQSQMELWGSSSCFYQHLWSQVWSSLSRSGLDHVERWKLFAQRTYLWASYEILSYHFIFPIWLFLELLVDYLGSTEFTFTLLVYSPFFFLFSRTRDFDTMVLTGISPNLLLRFSHRCSTSSILGLKDTRKLLIRVYATLACYHEPWKRHTLL